MNKKLISMFLVMTLLASFLPQTDFMGGAVAAPDVTVMLDGAEVEQVSVDESESRELVAVTSAKADAYQWQILMNIEKDLWVDISGMDKANARVSNSLVRSLSDASASAYVRCAVQVGGAKYFSQPVCVTIRQRAVLWSENGGDYASAAGAADVASVQAAAKQTAASEDTATASATAAKTEPQTVQKAPRKAPADEAKGGSEMITITINYLDATSGNQLYQSFTAVVEKGSTYENDVISPTYLGFAPKYNAVTPSAPYGDKTTTDSAAQIEIKKGTNDKEDITYNVYYVAIEVPYAARYFFQNIHDDQYTERIDLYRPSVATTGTIITDTKLAEHVGDTTGFTILYHYPEQVAADGSTVFELYYDRNYYLMKFDMTGGYGVEPVYARYETPFVVNKPTRPGYVFKGWDVKDNNGAYDGAADPLPQTIPAENREYKAIWEQGNTTVKYVYWKQNADDDGYSFVYFKEYGAKSGEKRSGEDDADVAEFDDKRFFTFDGDKTDKDKIVEGDGSTIINVYYNRKVYNLKFVYARKGPSGGFQVCGFTNEFSLVKNSRDLKDLLANSNGRWSDVKAKPVPNDPNNYYTLHEFSNDPYTYYYLSFDAKYNQNIREKWPIDVFDNAERETPRHNTTVSAFAAWAPEYFTQYIQQNTGNNWTVKGRRTNLDMELMLTNNPTVNVIVPDRNELCFMSFWTNAHTDSSVTWDKTYKWIYELYFQDEDGNYSVSANETIDTYDTNKNETLQKAPIIDGYELPQKYGSTETLTKEPGTEGTYKIKYKYARKSFNVTYENRGDNDTVADWGTTMKYGASLKDLPKGAPKPPKALEAGAYEFKGWYTNEYGEGKPFNFEEERMPAANVKLYAYWVPKVHKVNFFASYDDMLQFEAGTTPNWIVEKDVPHGDTVGSVTEPPALQENGITYSFGGWFYFDDGVKTAYTPLDSPITKDMNIFAGWGSHTAQPFRIQYVKKDDHTVKVAEDTVGYGYQGTTRTFTAKAGAPYNQLYPAFNSGFFPTLASHAITLKYEENKEDLKNNIFTFEYVNATNIKYTVKYVNRITGESVHTDYTTTTTNAVVTERFEPVTGFVPDAFYKRLVLAVEWDPVTQTYVGAKSNEIIFYYTPSENTAFYAVHYMMQKQDTAGTDFKIDGTGDFEEAVARVEGTGTVGEPMDVPVPEFSGFTLMKDEALVYKGQGQQPSQINYDENNRKYVIEKITREGAELYIFYSRNSYSYTVEHRDYDNKNILFDSKTVANKPYDSVITLSFDSPDTKADAEKIEGYKPISTGIVTLRIRADDTQNKVIFYYTKEKYTVEYVAVGNGTLDNTSEVFLGDKDPQGSTPTANPGFAFVGWYTDEACTEPVNNTIAQVDINTKKIEPVKSKLLPSPQTNTFYAKFEEQFGSLTITRSAANDEGNGTQVFVYKITNNDYQDIVVYATITGDGSVIISNLRQGNYTVEQQNQWSWRYSDGAQTAVKVGATGGSPVVFEGKATNGSWLNGNSPIKVNKKGGA